MSDSCDPTDYSPIGSSLQARILEWVATSFSKGSSQPRNRTWVSCIAGRFEKLLNHTKTLGFLASGGGEFNLGPETRLDRSELLCNKVLLKYKGDRESFWHRHQKWGERVPACLVLAMELYTLQWIQRMSEGGKGLTRPPPIIYILR